jgi:hypothetical protein
VTVHELVGRYAIIAVGSGLIATASAEPLDDVTAETARLVESLPRTWGLEIGIATEAKVPFLGRIHILSRSLVLSQIMDSPSGPIMSQRMCGVVIEDDAKLSDTLIPASFVQALPVQKIPLSPVPAGDGWTVRLDPGPTYVGYDPEVAGEGVPSEIDDPAVVDFDGDGLPGATVQLKVSLLGHIDLYIVQRGHTILDGFGSETGVEGAVIVEDLTQKTLGASHRMFARQSSVIVDAAHSRFRMHPIADDADCDDWLKQWSPMASEWVSTRRQVTGWTSAE